MPTANNTKRSELVRGLGLWAATAVIIGGMVGQSIFLVPSEIARDVGSIGRVFAAWLVGGKNANGLGHLLPSRPTFVFGFLHFKDNLVTPVDRIPVTRNQQTIRLP